MAGRRFRFNLQKVLDLRMWEEKQAETALAAKTGQCSACQKSIEALLTRRHETFLSRATGGLDLTVLAAHDAFSLRLAREIETQQKVLARLTVEREDLMAAYVEARKRRDVLAKLAEKEALAFKKAEAQRETLRLDDLNTAAFIRRMGAVEESGG